MNDNPAVRAEQQFFDDPAVDRLMGVLMALATEHYVLRDRYRALEGQLAAAGKIDVAALDDQPGASELGANRQDRDEFVNALLQPLLGEQQSLGATGRFSLRGK